MSGWCIQGNCRQTKWGTGFWFCFVLFYFVVFRDFSEFASFMLLLTPSPHLVDGVRCVFIWKNNKTVASFGWFEKSRILNLRVSPRRMNLAFTLSAFFCIVCFLSLLLVGWCEWQEEGGLLWNTKSGCPWKSLMDSEFVFLLMAQQSTLIDCRSVWNINSSHSFPTNT